MFAPKVNKENNTTGPENSRFEEGAVQSRELTISSPADRDELEAENIADEVIENTKKPADIQQKENDTPNLATLHRKTLDSKITANTAIQQSMQQAIQRSYKIQPKQEEEKDLQRKEENNTTPQAPDGLKSQLDSSKGSGAKLPGNTRQQMEGAFGADFSNVSIHTGTDAVQASQSIGASAFTYGSDIYFNEGEYNPESEEGKHLIAHELTHTIQQGGSRTGMVQRKELYPKKIADNYFKGVIGYTFEKLQTYLGSDKSAKQNIRLQNILSAIIYLNKDKTPQQVWDQIVIDPTALKGYDAYTMLTTDQNLFNKYEKQNYEIIDETNLNTNTQDITTLTTSSVEYTADKKFFSSKEKEELLRKEASKITTTYIQTSSAKFQGIVKEANDSKETLKNNANLLLTDITAKIYSDALEKEKNTYAQIPLIKNTAKLSKERLLDFYHGSLTVIDVNTQKQQDKVREYYSTTVEKLSNLKDQQDKEIEKLYSEFANNVNSIVPGLSKQILEKGRQRYIEHQISGFFGNSFLEEHKGKAAVKASQDADLELHLLASETIANAEGSEEDYTGETNTKASYKLDVFNNLSVVTGEIMAIQRETLILLDEKAEQDKKAAKILYDEYEARIDDVTLGTIQSLMDSLDIYYQKLNEFGSSKDLIIKEFYNKAVENITSNINTNIQSSKAILESLVNSQQGQITPETDALQLLINNTEAEFSTSLTGTTNAIRNQIIVNNTEFEKLKEVVNTDFTNLSLQGTIIINKLVESSNTAYGSIKEAGIKAQKDWRIQHLRKIILDVKSAQKGMDAQVASFIKTNEQQLADIKLDLSERLSEFEKKANDILLSLDKRMDEAENQVQEDYESGKLQRTQNIIDFQDAKLKLTGTEDAYTIYKKLPFAQWPSFLVKNEEINKYKTGLYKDDIIKLEELLLKHGFKGGIPEYYATLNSFEQGFRLATTATAFELVLEYERKLKTAKKDYSNLQYVESLYQKMAPYRKIAEESLKYQEIANKLAAKTHPHERSAIEPFATEALTEEEQKTYDDAYKKVEQGKIDGRKFLKELYSEHPIFDDESDLLEFRIPKDELGKADSPSQLQNVLLNYINGRQDNVNEVKENLTSEEGTRDVYGMTNVLPVVFERFAITPESFPGTIIQEDIDNYNTEKLVIGILLAIVAIVLTIISMGTATPALVAGFAAGGAFAISIYDVYVSIKQYENQYDYASLNLTSEPSFIWVILSIAGAGFDVGPFFKSVKLVTGVNKAAKVLDATGDVAEFTRTIKILQETEQLEEKVAETIIRAAQARKGYLNAVQEFRSMTGRLNSGVDPSILAPLTKMAFFKIKEGVANFEQFLLIVKRAWNKSKLDPEELALAKQAWRDAQEGVETGVTKYIDEAAELFDESGKFIDEALESSYQKYVKRKSGLKTNNIPKNRTEWKKARDYWMNDSPVARGNNFNKKAVDNEWYPYNEVHLSNGKRVDSYKPPHNGEPGQIVSRKATNLDEIELDTFESYLKELKKKYASGTPIQSAKYPNLKGTKLEGDLILEIPDVNKSLPNIQDYINLANEKYGIQIVFKPE